MSNWRLIRNQLPKTNKEVLIKDFENCLFVARMNTRYLQNWWTEERTFLRPVHPNDQWLYREEVEDKLNAL